MRSFFTLGVLIGAVLVSIFISAMVGDVTEIRRAGGVIIDPAKFANSCGVEWAGNITPDYVEVRFVFMTSLGHNQCGLWLVHSDVLEGWEPKIEAPH